MVTSIRLGGALIGGGVPLAGALVLYWLGRLDPTRMTGLFLLGALGGIPLGAIVGSVLGPMAVESDRPVLVAGLAALLGGGAGLAGFAVLGSPGGSLPGGGFSFADLLLSALLVSPVVMIAWAVAMPFALASTFLGRRLYASGLRRTTVGVVALAIAAAGALTALDALFLRR